MVSAAGAADCAQGDGTYVRQKNMPAIYKLLSVNPGMETGSADFINERLTSSIRDLKYQTICNQIMMESCTAILVQANQTPMSILKLLGG